MDFVNGLDAAKLLSDRYRLGMPIEEAARIVTAVASALDYAHKHGLLHRDVGCLAGHGLIKTAQHSRC
jgi:serine/threonine protein kinase